MALGTIGDDRVDAASKWNSRHLDAENAMSESKRNWRSLGMTMIFRMVGRSVCTCASLDRRKVVRPATARSLLVPGRPLKENPKKPVSLRLDPDVIEAFRAKGKAGVPHQRGTAQSLGI